jgi:hypothetical protein
VHGLLVIIGRLLLLLLLLGTCILMKLVLIVSVRGFFVPVPDLTQPVTHPMLTVHVSTVSMSWVVADVQKLAAAGTKHVLSQDCITSPCRP